MDGANTEAQEAPQGDQGDAVEATKAVPVEALQAERTKRQALEARLAEIEAAQAERERKEAETRGEYERLYKDAAEKLSTVTAELGTLREREQARRAALIERNAARLGDLPSHLQAVVQALGDDADPEVVSRQLDALAAAKADDAPPTGSRVRGGAPAIDPKIDQWRKSNPRYQHLSDEAATRVYRAKHKG